MINPSPKLTAGEEILLHRIKNQDSEAWQAFTAGYAAPLYQFLFSLLGGDAAEAKERCLRAVLKTLTGVRNVEEAPGLHLLLFRAAIADLRGRPFAASPSAADASQLKSSGPQTSDAANEKRLRVILRSLLNLPWEDRVFLLLRDQWDFSYPEIAFIMGSSKRGESSDSGIFFSGKDVAGAELREWLRQVRIRFYDFLERQLQGDGS